MAEHILLPFSPQGETHCANVGHAPNTSAGPVSLSCFLTVDIDFLFARVRQPFNTACLVRATDRDYIVVLIYIFLFASRITSFCRDFSFLYPVRINFVKLFAVYVENKSFKPSWSFLCFISPSFGIIWPRAKILYVII